MAPPLLPVTRLVVCAACSEHVKVSDDRCPHCGVTLPGRAGLLARAAGVALASVMLVGCTEAQAVYGVPTSATEGLDTDPSSGSSGNTTGDGTATADSSSTAVPTSTGSESSGTTTGDTTTGGSESSGESSGSSGESSGSSSTTMAPETSGEPDYGVPSTTTGPEPDYGVPGTT